MSNVVFFNSYKLKKGTNIPEFLQAVETLINEHVSKQKGFISSQITADGDNWADFTTFETLQDAKNFAESDTPNSHAEHFYSFLNFNSCITRYYEVKAAY
ncbi:MAG: hypothetical protein FWC78_04615 [Defluviitaleaceae bacterium]|nr:hypothetical protein [Defluviitaleaceae bacterium]